MIFNSIVDLSITLGTWIMNLFPVATEADTLRLFAIQDAITTTRTNIIWCNFFVPLDDIYAFCYITVLLYISMIGIEVIRIIINR